ncbi:MAG TPA: MauE/DoxX family redox-associated membrane protein [Nitrospirota bacterium]|nr:MauE/DoxX family redox-associated membrane protein [Nitrospirota bacterium]
MSLSAHLSENIRTRIHPRAVFTSVLIRTLIGASFVIAGVLKLADPAAFAWTVYQYGLLPRNFLDIVAIGLPAIEIIAGIGLLFNMRGSAAVIAVLLILFLFILGYALQRGLEVDCGCFSPGETGPDGLRRAIMRDVLMLIGLCYVYWIRRRNTRDNLAHRQLFAGEDAEIAEKRLQ